MARYEDFKSTKSPRVTWYLPTWVGWIFVVISAVVSFLIYPTDGEILVPFLIPVLGYGFDLCLAGATIFLSTKLPRRAFFLVLGALVVGGLGAMGGSMLDPWGEFEKIGLSLAWYASKGATLTASLAFGIYLGTGQVYRAQWER